MKIKGSFYFLLIISLLAGCTQFISQDFKCTLKKDPTEIESFSYKGDSGVIGNQNLKLCRKQGNVLYFNLSAYGCSAEDTRDSIIRVEFDIVSKELQYMFKMSGFLLKNYSCTPAK